MTAASPPRLFIKLKDALRPLTKKEMSTAARVIHSATSPFGRAALPELSSVEQVQKIELREPWVVQRLEPHWTRLPLPSGSIAL